MCLFCECSPATRGPTTGDIVITGSAFLFVASLVGAALFVLAFSAVAAAS